MHTTNAYAYNSVTQEHNNNKSDPEARLTLILSARQHSTWNALETR